MQEVHQFDREQLDYLGRNTKLLTRLRHTNMLDDDTVDKLERIVNKFKLEFQTGEGKPLASVGREEFQAANAEDVDQEKIVRSRR